MHVLIVDDSKLLRFMMNKILTDGLPSVHFVVASDGLEALEKFKEMIENGVNLHLVLTDCQMPNMDGYELTREIRRLEKHSEKAVPCFITALSAYVMVQDRVKCFDAGFDEVLHKPVPRDDIVKHVKQVIKMRVSKIRKHKNDIL